MHSSGMAKGKNNYNIRIIEATGRRLHQTFQNDAGDDFLFC